MALRVRTELRASSVHGVGLFAAEPIAMGCLVWDFDPGLDHLVPAACIEWMHPSSQVFVRDYCVRIGQAYLVFSGPAAFANHSDEPNCRFDRDRLRSVAARAIAPGEELFDDYRELCDDVRAHGLGFAPRPPEPAISTGGWPGGRRRR